MSFWHYPKYVPVGKKKIKAEKKIKQLRKKNPDIKPVTVEGKSLSTTWWGKAWNENLERYADYSNRIERGRSYLRYSAVIDLQIKEGQVTSMVMGSSSTPYSILIEIKPMSHKNWKQIKKECAGKLDSLQELIVGKFPKNLKEIFTTKKTGLFPSPDEIEFSCNCPDGAYMCKHIAATLYGIAVRMDKDPSLFFKLRKVDIDDLISVAVKESAKNLLKKAKRKTSRVIDDADISDVFGIDLDISNGDGYDDDIVPLKKSSKKRKPANKKRDKKLVEVKAKKTGKIKKLQNNILVTDVIENIIKKHKKGISLDSLSEISKFDKKKVKGTVYRLKKKGIITNINRGVYKKL